MTEKLRESALSAVPIAAIVSVMCLCVIPTETDLLLSFLVGTAFIILGMGLFSLGAEPVSYTHLDVYKRQALCRALRVPSVRSR